MPSIAKEIATFIDAEDEEYILACAIGAVEDTFIVPLSCPCTRLHAMIKVKLSREKCGQWVAIDRARLGESSNLRERFENEVALREMICQKARCCTWNGTLIRRSLVLVLGAGAANLGK